MKISLLFLISILLGLNVSAQEDYALETILQKGHSKYITASDFHPSGKYLLTAGYDNSIILWNLNSGKEIRMYNRHTGPIWSVVFSNDGKQILSTSADNTSKIYDVLSGELIHSISMPNDDIRQAYYSPNGTLFYLVNNRDGIYVYDSKSGERIGEYTKNYGAYYQRRIIDPTGTKILSTGGYKGTNIFDLATGDTILHLPFDKTYGMAFSPDGKYVSLSSTKLFAKIFDAETGLEKAELMDPDSEAKCDGCNTKQVWSNSGKYLLTMSNKIDAILWDIPSGKKLRTFSQERSRPVNLKFSPDDSHVLLSFDDEIYVYNTKTAKQTLHTSNSQISYYEINFSPDGTYILVPGPNNTGEMWNIKTGKRKRVFSGYLNHGRDDGLRYSYDNWTDVGILNYITKRRGFDLSPDGKLMAIGNIDSTVLIVDLFSGKVIQELIGHSQVVLCYDFAPDGRTIATAGGDRVIKIWDVATGKEIETIRGHRNLVFDLDYNSDGTKLVSGSWDGTMGIWNLENGEFRIKDLGNNSPYCVGFTPNDLYVITGDLGKSTNFWEVDAAESFRSLVGHTNIMGRFDISPDGTRIATSSWDGKVKVWDMLTGMLLARFSKHDGPVYSVAYHPMGEYLASGGADNSIFLWNPSENKIIKKLEGHSNAISHVEFTNDGKYLVSISVEGMTKIWDLTTFNEVYSRVQISRNEWLSTTSNGFFDGSSKALNLVNYVSGMETVPVNSLFDKYYTPKLIERLFSGESFDDSGENLNKIIQETPTVAFHLTNTGKRSLPVDHDSVYQSKQEVIPLGIEINSNGVNLEEIRIYNNGKLIITESLEENIVFRGGDKDIKNFDIPLNDGQNLITAVVVNEDRTESNPTKVLVEFDGEAALTDLFILSIGINEYKNPAYNLDYAVNDSKAFTKALKKGADSLFNSVVTYSLTNEEATKELMNSTVEEIKGMIGPEDVFVFYYAGHGVMSYEENEEDSDFYIVTYDITNLYGDTQMLEEKAVSATELMEFSMEVVAEKQLFILDACHSGGALEAFSTRGDGREKALAQLARSTGTFFLTASQDAQYANEVGTLKHGLFTYALLELLEGNVPGNGDNKITINELKSYADERVPELSEEYHGSPQYPTSYSFGQDFPIVILK